MYITNSGMSCLGKFNDPILESPSPPLFPLFVNRVRSWPRTPTLGTPYFDFHGDETSFLCTNIYKYIHQKYSVCIVIAEMINSVYASQDNIPTKPTHTAQCIWLGTVSRTCIYTTYESFS